MAMPTKGTPYQVALFLLFFLNEGRGGIEHLVLVEFTPFAVLSSLH